MAEIVNLRQARKRRGRTAKDAEAAENRSRFGQSKAERTRAEDDRDRARRHLDGHRLGDGADAESEADPE